MVELVDFLFGQRLFNFAGNAYDHRTRGHDHAGWHYRSCGNDRFCADHRVVQDLRAHPNQAAILNRAAMNHRAVANRHVIADVRAG